MSNILGVSAADLPTLHNDMDPPSPPRSPPRTPARTTTLKPVVQDKRRKDQDDLLADYQDHYREQEPPRKVDSVRRTEEEYYNKKDLLPKLTKPQDQVEGEKKPAVSPDGVGSSKSKSMWSMAWQAHIYFSGVLFVLLALYCTISICRLNLFSRLFSRGFFLSLNLCMLVVGVSRGVFLLWDAYNEAGSLYAPIAYILLNIGYPCITSSFAILFLALLRVTQVELLSPSVQTPRALSIFCCVHLLISISLDITVGLVTKLQYLLLLGQGIFIVWSLLLSAGYFYIYSTMKKVVSRQQCEMNRSVYPKLMYDQTGSGAYSMRLPTTHSNPLSRAVNLTLGVAVLGSLIGGVQLYGMIGMHGLLRTDPRDIPDPWYGYQVALRVLEILICFLLALVATTPLRQDGSAPPGRGCSSCSPLLCCSGEGNCQKCGVGENPPTQLDEEIYTEICSNNHAVRVLNPADSYNQTLTSYNQISNSLSLTEQNQNVHCTATLALSASGQHLTNTLARRRGQAGQRSSQHSGDTSATMDTALYTNLRSRPSSMLFNDAGFVRFRLGNDPSLAQTDVLSQSSQDLAESRGPEAGQGAEALRESIRGSRSFDEGLLTEIKKNFQDKKIQGVSPLERPQSNLSYSFKQNQADSRQIKSELCSPDVEGIPGLPQRPASKLTTHNRTASPLYNRNTESDTDVGEQYEAPAGLILTEATKSLAAQVRSVVGYSESDLSSLDPVYAGGKSIYGYASRAPSRCSSISATQSFDMRVYGRTGPSGAATLGRPVKPKLENKFYYYGSTRGQKKSSHKETLTPRPLLPSQRVLGGETRLGPSPLPPKGAPSPNNPSQSLYDQIMGNQRDVSSPYFRDVSSPSSLAIQRSRSLGRDAPPPTSSNLPPRPPGARTPTSVARKVLESVTKRRSKEKRGRRGEDPAQQSLLAGQLVQTADGRLVAVGPGNTLVEVGTFMDPRARARQISQDREQMLYGGGEFAQGNANGREIYGRLPFNGRLQGEVQGTPPASRAGKVAWQGQPTYPQQSSYQDPNLVFSDSQLFQDQSGQIYAVQPYLPEQYNGGPPFHPTQYRDDIYDDKQFDEYEGMESEIDSELSSLFSYDRDIKNLHLISPLEYAAMLKQQYTEPSGVLGKDITPDSGVIMDSRNHSKERDARSRRDHFSGGTRNLRNSEQIQQLEEQLGQLGEQLGEQLRHHDSSCSEDSSSEREESSGMGNESYSRVPQQDQDLPDSSGPYLFKWEGSSLVPTDPRTLSKRVRKISVDSTMSETEPLSKQFSPSSEKESTVESSPGVAGAKIADVCNEIKARFP
ncbi:uncharacterized protein LOC111709480 [Eurytemora carolleeae]|uniref:uncharacterized protein LOC111709480 n=1 Tax=Eurytemora carolleeae TaxID=1294199 RepID=UPI000C78CC2D|nr:uncharacterized protein LOC111709480 [Eurytemora carolleeae]|eukprot:XP_023338915.1 uncharacterized protein LOC111709480 [Eurytemora affinis]